MAPRQTLVVSNYGYIDRQSMWSPDVCLENILRILTCICLLTVYECFSVHVADIN